MRREDRRRRGGGGGTRDGFVGSVRRDVSGDRRRVRCGRECRGDGDDGRPGHAGAWDHRGSCDDDREGHAEARRRRRQEDGIAAEEARGRRVELRRRNVLDRHEEDLLSVPARVRGVGLGLRWDFLDELVERTAALESSTPGARLPIDFLEISPENYMRRGGRHPAALEWLAERYPVVTHGLTMSLGGVDPLDEGYLRDLAAFLRDVGTPWHSDHMCFGAVDGRAMHDLLPVSLKRASVSRVADRIRRARDGIGVPLAVENVSFYWHPGRAEMGEAEFLARTCEAADCGLMLDVNNAYVNAQNFGFDVDTWMREAPLDRVVQIHVAGHEWFAADDRGLRGAAVAGTPGAMIIDTHGTDVPDPVLALLARVLAKTGPVPVLLERDQNVPSLDALLAEMGRIRECTVTSVRSAS
jgi:uncharacterized protein (UPF0276 family)